jgi:hypothetical protein
MMQLREAFIEFFQVATTNDPGENISDEVVAEYGTRMARFVGVDERDLMATVESLFMLNDEDRPRDIVIVALMVGYLAGSKR